MAETDDRSGWGIIELTHVYDGFSIWLHPGTGEMVNRWAEYNESDPNEVYARRARLTQEWIDEHQEGLLDG